MNAASRPADVPPVPVPMTVEALRLLDEQGFFQGDPNRHELLDGVLIMSPLPGPGHSRVEALAARALVRVVDREGLGERWIVQPGAGFQIGELTLLGPDLMVVDEAASRSRLTTRDVLVLIEIAWSSRTFDMGDKARAYAGAGIADYWVLDVAAKSVIVHRDPVDGLYTSLTTIKAPGDVAALGEPRIRVAAASLFD